MGSPRYRFLVTFTVGSILLSATLAQVLAVGPPPIDANVAGKDIGVGYGNMTENTNVFDLVVNLVPPENQTILSSEKHDDDGDIIWNGPTKTTISDPPKREKHTWTGAGVLTNLQHQVRFHGTLGGPGPGSGVPPEFDVGVVDLDIDVNCTAAYTGDHSPPTGSLPEDKKEDEPLAGVMVEKGMIERLNPNNHTLPSMITPAQLATLHYVILRVNCQPRWHQSDSHVGDVAFTGSGLDSSYALYDIASGHKVYSLAISNTGLQKDLAIVTNNSFSAPADLTATYIWNSQKTTHQSGAEDIVRLLPLIVDLDIADLNEAQEDSPGGLVARQYQTQPVPRKAITLNSNATLGHVTLFKFTSKVKVYDAPSAGVEVTFNGTDNKFAVATLPKTLYVQGVEGSSTIGDVTLTLTHNEWGGSDSVAFTVFYLQSLTPSTWDVLCKGQGQVLPVSANIVPAIPDFDPNLVDWECNVGTLPGGGTTAHGLSTTWTQDNTYLSTAEDDVFVRAQCGSNGEWVTIRTTIIEVNTLTVRDKHFPSNTVTVNSPSAGDLYLRDPGGGVTIEMQMTTTPTVSQSQWDNVCWKISGLAAAPSSGNFGGAVEAQLTPNPNRTFTVEVGFDKNGNGGLDANEVARTVNVCLITVSSMTVTDHATPSNTVTNPSGTSLVVAEDPTSGHALVDLSASWLPGAAGVGARVLWTVAGASPVPASGDFGAASYTTIQLTGSSGNRTATVSVGVDGNANGALDAGEISHSVIVGVAQVVLTVEDAGGAKGAVPLTECMVGRNVTFTATVTDNFPCGVTNPIWFTFHYEAPDGTPVTDDDWSTDRVEDNTRHMPDFVDSNGDHKYTTPVHVVADNDGVRGTSNTLSIDVYQLWIKHFKDYHTGKDWQVCVDNYALPSADQHWIDYDAYASSDCESWSWSMPDGFPDTWHLYVDGQFAKAGHNIYIPEGDLPYDSHWDYFGDSYGTVYVFCEDGEGNNHSFYSSSMSPSKKAEVFFDPTGTTHPGGTSKNWFYYWKYALFGSTGDINWNAGTFYMQCASNGVITVGESGNVNYATAFSHASYHGYARPTADGKSKIDLFYCFVTHELQHRADFPFFDVGTDTDGDHLPDTIDPFPAAVNGVAYPEYTGGTAWQGDWEQRARAVEGVAASADKDWSKGGKQW